MKSHPLLASSAFLFVAACNAGPGEAAMCAWASASTPSPDGEGWCCAPSAPTCECGDFGGFAADRCDCGRPGGPTAGYCDLAPPDWIAGTDAHGCAAYTARLPATACCNCPDGGRRLDTAADAHVEIDASFDPTTDGG